MSNNSGNGSGKTENDEVLEIEESIQMIAPGIQRNLQQEVVTGFFMNLVSYPILVIAFLLTFRYLTTRVVPYLFIDEFFHVNQTIKYIKNDWFTWDPKITTPPGLYILGWLNYHIFRVFTSWSTLTILRLVNLIGGIVVLPIVVLRPLFLFNAIGFWPITLMCFPLMTTYYYLYYTDVWSTIFILQSLNFVLTLPFGERTSIWLSGIFAGISCLFRQTNIIWTGFIMVIAIERRAAINKKFNSHTINNYLKLLIHAFDEFETIVLPYFINYVLFFIYLIWNRSITLGDKSNHSAGIHLVQIFYCFLFITFFSLPLWLSRNFLRNYRTRWQVKQFQCFIEIIGIMLTIRFFTKVHPFLLADNRHFTFYLFKRIIGNPRRLFKYVLMAPVYHFSIFTYLEVLRPSEMTFHPIMPLPVKEPIELPIQLTHISWTALILCTMITLIPSPLFEPRYYILPYYFWRIFVTCTAEPIISELVPAPEGTPAVTIGSTRRLSFEFLWFAAINVFTILVFIKHPFSWNSEQFPQRIIW
ncbi:hypothetical protein Kpol_1050p59 [Vanderwaltozyma polyspora DSM 70294]|uniref:Dol-P-Glc:Glc(2)Man(9)GlcNAc(2)-PP-Dol alpha-1,2-glucosyltransferase n=1 Tax=Vanderwaltozyma polyspora (strain ATCC 22028 / DSM 70294 / BCRC 21397 / CBS 2163 / NBRC 10782 / NRRL Y-8283 / UCD 57-17) TaxID=436907 RepID=A7TEV5_VANPO|nr:uncharacterized protein Kpol_1050p59 [Vanderwaltozyma polyspora DSM 70294]EDO19201.1 hypothetical protein Kpol_1050p59 [Vanderwaltozyma polyspora DSM 70294]